jgi:RNA polymerase sigma-70 factor (ECF subfamily)
MADSLGRTEELLAHAGWIRELARRLVGDGPAADDLVQDTWLAALRRRPDGGRPLRPWLARVARNFARQAGRRRTMRPDAAGLGELAEPAARTVSPEQLALRGELQARLVQRVLELREPFRSTVLLRFYEGLGTDEIARVQRVERATVRSRLKRAIDELRLRLDAEHGGERGSWVQALMPLTGVAAPTLSGVMANTTLGKVAVAAGALGLVALGGLGLREALRPAGVAAGDDVVAGATLAPVDGPTRAEPLDVAGGTVPEPGGDRERALVASEVPVAPDPGARWQATIVDAATGEPLPEYALELRAGEHIESLATDGDGRVRTERRYRTGAFEVKPVDDPRLALDRAAATGMELAREEVWIPVAFDEAEGTPRELPVEVGPTYELDLRSERDVDPDELRAVVLGHGISFRDTIGSFYGAPVRGADDGAPAWVRFMPLPTAMLPRTAPWRLEVYARDGFWFGAAEVDSIVGRSREPVVVELQARGRVVGTVRDDAGAPVAGVPVQLRPVDAAGEGVRGATDAAGRFALEWAPAADYRLAIEPSRHEPEARDVRVRALETQEVDVRLRARAIAGDVRGRIVSSTGTYANPCFVLLDGRGPGTPDMNRELEWFEEDGRMVGAFAFEDLPTGEYVVSVLSMLDKYPWSPSKLTVRPPATELLFEVADDLPTAHVTFEVVDAETGEPVEPFTLSYSANGAGSIAIGGLGASGPHLADFPDGGELMWVVVAEGYASAFGDEADFDLGPGGAPLVRVPLRRGWSARITAVRADTHAPVAGAEIELDGEVVARTDEDGRATVTAAKAPTRVLVRAGELSGRADDLERLGRNPGFVYPIVLR